MVLAAAKENKVGPSILILRRRAFLLSYRRSFRDFHLVKEPGVKRTFQRGLVLSFLKAAGPLNVRARPVLPLAERPRVASER